MSTGEKKMEPLATQHVLINESRIAYGIYGQGAPLVLLHGTPSSSLIWRNVLPGLVSAGYKVHVYDLLGFGLSERPWDPAVDTSMTGQVPILEGLLAHWGLAKGRFHLAAHDIGGGVAQRFAVESPGRLRSLTLVDVVSHDSYPSPRTREQMRNGLDALARAPDADHRSHFRGWLLSAVRDEAGLGRSGALDAYLSYISGPLGQASFFEHQVRHYDPKHTVDVSPLLGPTLSGDGGGGGQVPVKIIWGADDSWQVPSWAARLAGEVPGSELDLVEGAGHFSLEDRPDRISELLVAFLGKH
ncbi:hypothetical protein N3K66_001488 [Trichothecium roseum]|uniref:Uncharacterized protein n=1 Tax=Trichothecium roseum TaxID=47278 RepID=A0ACC0VEX0_9HYPO|nr:hypothetical protein N3K66_001488 [Trichothecium roseum]